MGGVQFRQEFAHCLFECVCGGGSFDLRLMALNCGLPIVHSAFRENRTSSVERQGTFSKMARLSLASELDRHGGACHCIRRHRLAPDSDFGMRRSEENAVRITVEFESGPVVRRGA